jgi:hypothetical protein
MLESVFEGKVLFFTNLGKLLLQFVRARIVDEVVGSSLSVTGGSGLVSKEMEEDFGFFFI